MVNISKNNSFNGKNFPFGYITAKLPLPESWDTAAFRSLAESEISLLKEKFSDYDRKTVWGENPYYRFFKKFKKTYPVMLQAESVILKGRPFPCFNPVSEIAFLFELTTFVLSGAHDISCIDGDVTVYMATEKEDFEGIRETLHTYPGDLCARDSSGIIFSEIAGTDSRTCAKPSSTEVLYPIFAVPDMDTADIVKAAETLKKYICTLAPDAEIKFNII